MREALKLTLTTAAANLPLSLNEVKTQLRVETDQVDEDALLMALIRSAVEQCEQFTGRALITQTWTLFRDAWPRVFETEAVEGIRTAPVLEGAARALELPRPPLQVVSFVKIYDESDTAVTWDAANYFVDTASEPGRLVVRSGRSVPVPGRGANGIEIRFMAGFGDDPDAVPEAIRQGLMQMVTHLYEHRGDMPSTAGQDSGALPLWRPYRILGL